MSFPGFKYRGFGLNICSNIEFPELFPVDFDEADLEIQSAAFEDPWFSMIDPGLGRQQIQPDTFRLRIPGVGRYQVCHGRMLKMDADQGADPSAFRMYALTYAMSACIVQRGQTLLHASGIVLNGKVILFAGASGSGKSTIISRFNQKGYSIFSDDVCVLDGRMNDEGRALVSASYPLVKLDSRAITRYFPDATPMNLWPDSEKKGVGFHKVFDSGRKPLAGVITISTDPDATSMEVSPILGLQAFRRLTNCVYRKSLIRHVGQQSDMTRMLTTLADRTPVFSVSRPTLPDDGTALSELLEEFILGRFSV